MSPRPDIGEDLGAGLAPARGFGLAFTVACLALSVGAVVVALIGLAQLLAFLNSVVRFW